MSQTYSFKNVNVFLTIDVGIQIGIIPVGIPINLAAKDFFGKDGSITVTPYPNAIQTEDISVDGVMIPGVSNDQSGDMVIRVGDMSGAHYLLSTLFNFHKQGLLVKKLGINVLQRPVGTSEDALLSNILYSGTRGSIKSLPGKSWGARQNGNDFNFKFESLTGATTIGLAGAALQVV
jgi:hypothetical protein